MPIRRRTNSAGLSVSDREIRSHSGTDGTVYLDGEPQQAFQASTICIRSLVVEGRHEFIDQIAAGTMELDKVHPGLLDSFCGIRKGCHHHFICHCL